MSETKDPQILQFARMIRDALIRTKSIEFAVSELRDMLAGSGMLN